MKLHNLEIKIENLDAIIQDAILQSESNSGYSYITLDGKGEFYCNLDGFSYADDIYRETIHCNPERYELDYITELSHLNSEMYDKYLNDEIDNEEVAEYLEENLDCMYNEEALTRIIEEEKLKLLEALETELSEYLSIQELALIIEEIGEDFDLKDSTDDIIEDLLDSLDLEYFKCKRTIENQIIKHHTKEEEY